MHQVTAINAGIWLQFLHDFCIKFEQLCNSIFIYILLANCACIQQALISWKAILINKVIILIKYEQDNSWSTFFTTQSPTVVPLCWSLDFNYIGKSTFNKGNPDSIMSLRAECRLLRCRECLSCFLNQCKLKTDHFLKQNLRIWQ